MRLLPTFACLITLVPMARDGNACAQLLGPVQVAKLTAADAGANDFFGKSVALSGDTALVGAYSAGDGSAYVFVRSGAVWSQQAKLTSADGGQYDSQFGYSVALSGDTALVGAITALWGIGQPEGAASVFVRSGTVWAQQAQLSIPYVYDGYPDYFGWSVALSGDTAVVTASGGNYGLGSAIVFVRSGTQWSQQAALTASDATVNDDFGHSVALSGDTVLVGAYYKTGVAGVRQGAAYVFVRSGTVWTQQAKLTADDATAEDQFGWSVAVSGDTALVGAHLGDATLGGTQGAAYVFVRSGNVWSQQAKLTADDAAQGDYFGSSAALSGDTALVGARGDDSAPGWDQGSAYVFTRTGIVWSQQAKLTAADAGTYDYFGNSVALSGDTFLVGVERDDGPAGMDQGSAYVFNIRVGACCKPDGTCVPDVTASDCATQGGTYHGNGTTCAQAACQAIPAVSSWGMLALALLTMTAATLVMRTNRELRSHPATTIITTTTKTAHPLRHLLLTALFAICGAALATAQTPFCTSLPQLLASDRQTGDRFGDAVELRGDLIIVGAPGANCPAGADCGAAYVYRFNGSIWIQETKLTASDAAAGDQFGYSVAVDGQVALVGAINDDCPSNADCGAAYLFRYNGSTWVEEQKLRSLSQSTPADGFGHAVAIRDNVAIITEFSGSADQCSLGGGAIHVFRFNGSAWVFVDEFSAVPCFFFGQFGNDLSFDGTRLVAGHRWADCQAGGQGCGAAHLYRATDWALEIVLTASDGAQGDDFGESVDQSGNVILVGAWGDDCPAGPQDCGSAYVRRFDGANWTEDQKLRASDASVGDEFGRHVAISGGLAAVAAPYATGSVVTQTGAVYVFKYEGAQWQEQIKLTSTDTGPTGNLFGSSLSLDGAGLVVGAPNFPGGGAVFSYRCESVSPTGACCQTNGTCTPAVTPVACASLGGSYLGDGSSCDPAACRPIPAVSEWGMLDLALLAMTAATLVLRTRRESPRIEA